MRKAAVSTVVHNPRLSPTADCVMFIVRTILFEIRYTSFFSSQDKSGSNSTLSVVASISAASSSAYSPATSSVSPNEWCSLKYPYIGRSLGSASPMLAAIKRCGSFVEFSLITVNATWPGLMCFKPSLREMCLQFGGKIDETRTMLHAAIPALRRASSKLESRSRCLPTPLVKKIFLATNAIVPVRGLRRCKVVVKKSCCGKVASKDGECQRQTGRKSEINIVLQNLSCAAASESMLYASFVTC